MTDWRTGLKMKGDGCCGRESDNRRRGWPINLHSGSLKETTMPENDQQNPQVQTAAAPPIDVAPPTNQPVQAKPSDAADIKQDSPVGATTFYDLLRLVILDATLDAKQKADLLNELRKSGGADRWTFRSAIWILGTVVLLSIGALWVLTYYGKAKDNNLQGLIAIGSGAVGGLAGLLTPGRERSAGT
jgi:hypothetical protein